MKKLISGILCLTMVLSLFAGLSISASAECAHNRLETWDNGDGTHYVFCYDCNSEWTENCTMTVSERQDPACGVDGYERQICTGAQCGSSDMYSVTGGCGRTELTVLASQGDDHTYTWQVETEPTENAEGFAKLICCSCGAEPDNNTHTLPALTQANVGADGYTYTIEAEPSCEAPGTGVYSIALTNGDGTQETLEFTSEIPATGIHTIEWGVYQEPSEEESGQLAYMCTGCGTAEQLGAEMPVLTNTGYYTLTEHHAATCTQEGRDVYVSNPGVFDCCPDQQFTITVQTEAAGHSFTLADNGDGTHTGICSVCGETVTEPHMYDDENGNVCECGAEEALLFDFTNTEADRIKYESGLYGGINFDEANWARGGNSGAINNSGIGTLDCTTLNDGNTALWLVPSETGSASDGFVLNYHPEAGDIAEVRIRISSLTATVPSLSFRFFDGENDSTCAEEAATSFAGTSGRYAVVVIPLSEALRLEQISSFCLTINAAASGSEIGTASIDYIYIGAPSGAPSASAEGSNHVHTMGTVCSTTTGGMLSFEALQMTGGTLPAGDYFLSEDVTLTSTLTVSSGTVNLCLNGHVLNCGSNHIEVAGGTLNLCDCGNGCSISGTGNAAGAPINISGGAVTIYGGTVSNTATAAASGINDCMYCAINIASGTLNLKNGTLTSVIGDAVRNWETFVMEGGSIVSDGSAAVGVSNSGTARLMGGSISNANGGGVWNQGTAYLLDGVTISGIYGIKNTKSTTAGTLNIYGGTITSTGDYAIYNVHSEATVNFMGAPTLTAPLADIYMAASTVLNINGAVTGGPYRVKVDGTPTAAAPVTFANNWTKWNADTTVSAHFTAAGAGYGVFGAANGTSLCLAPTSGHSHDMSTACGENCPINFSTALTIPTPNMYENIIAAGKAVADFIETNHKLPSSVNIGTTSVNMRQFLWLGGKVIIGLNSGKTNESLSIPTLTSAPSPSESLTAGSLTKAQYVAMCTNTLNWISSNSNTLPNYCTVGSLGKMCPNNIAYTIAAILRSYKTNGTLPSSFAVKKWSTLTSGTVGTATKATASVEKELAAGNYYLTSDIDLTENLKISSGTVNLCLNGHRIRGASSSYHVIVSGGTLNICDCSGGTNGRISANNTSGTGALEVPGGTVNLYSGRIWNYATSADNISNACAIKINGGKVFLRGGTVQSDIGNAINCSSGELTVDNGSTVAAGNNAISNSGTTTLNSCSLSSSGGSAIWNQGTLTVNNGASVTGSRAIYNTCSSLNGTLNVNGGTITGTGNYAIENTSANNVLNLKGAPVINSDLADFYLKGNSTITPTDKVTGGPYTILTETAPTASALVNVVSSYSTATSIPDIYKHFTSASASYAIVRNGSWLKLALASGHIHDMSQECGSTGPMNCLATLPTSGTVSGGYYYLNSDLTLTGNLTIAASVNICLNGKTLNCGSNHIEIADGGSLYICDCGTTGKITGTVGDYCGVIRVNGGTDASAKGASLSIYGGTVVNTGTTTTAETETKMVAVNVNRGKATLLGDCSISSQIGKAVYVSKNATLSVQGAASISGGKIAINSDGTVNMTGGTASSTSTGIGASGGTVNISGGTIHGDNRGVNLNGAESAVITGGTISGAYAIAASGSPTLSGSPALNGSTADILLSDYAILGFADTLPAETVAPYTIATQTAPAAGTDILLTDALSEAINIENWQTYLASANEAYAIIIKDEEAWLHAHNIVTTEAVAPTCTTEGSTAGSTCEACGMVVEEAEVIPALGHNYTLTETPASCTEDGTKVYTCENCNDTYSETVPALGHSYASVATEATCTTAGYTTYTCTVCGDSYVADEVEAAGHSYAEEILTAATCAESGTVVYTCTNCGDTYTEEIAATGHDYQCNKTEVTCTTAGITTYTCANCGDTYTEEIAATGHDYQCNKTEVTCTTAGITTYTCANCGDTYTEETPALGHDYVETVMLEATCTDKGLVKKACSRCGVSSYSITAPLGHDYVWNGTVGAEGSHGVLCSRCNDASTEACTYENGICTICGAEGETPAEETVKIASAAPRLDADIDLLYTAAVPEGATNVYMVFTMHGTETRVEDDGTHTFLFEGVTPQCMGDNISAVLHAEYAGREYTDNIGEYSVRQYCVNMLSRYPEDTALQTMLSDLLTYGAAAQNYADYKTAEPVTADLALTPSTYSAISGCGVTFDGEKAAAADWTSAGLILSNDLAVRFVFRAESVENLSVAVSINGRTETYTAEDFEAAGSGRYCIEFRGIKATEFGDTVSASFLVNGKQVGRTVSYSVNAYICSTQNCENASLRSLVRALYNYGASAKAYASAR